MRHYVRHYVAMFRKWTKFGSNSWGIKFKNIGKQLRKLYNKKRVWNNMIYINNRPNLSLISVLLTSHFFFIYLNKSFIHSTYIIYHTTVDKNRNFFLNYFFLFAQDIHLMTLCTPWVNIHTYRIYIRYDTMSGKCIHIINTH